MIVANRNIGQIHYFYHLIYFIFSLNLLAIRITLLFVYLTEGALILNELLYALSQWEDRWWVQWLLIDMKTDQWTSFAFFPQCWGNNSKPCFHWCPDFDQEWLFKRMLQSYLVVSPLERLYISEENVWFKKGIDIYLGCRQYWHKYRRVAGSFASVEEKTDHDSQCQALYVNAYKSLFPKTNHER